MIRGVIRRAGERLLGGAWATRKTGARSPRDLLVLALHNVVPDGDDPRGDLPLHLPLSVFLESVSRLLEVCEPVDLREIADGSARKRAGFAVTFDDAYRGALLLALPELVKLGVPATVFVPTGFVGDRDFWWDVVAEPGRGLDRATREHLLHDLRGDDAAVRQWAMSAGRSLAEMDPLRRSATLDELRNAASLRGVSFAMHTESHRALDRLTVDEIRAELQGPLAWFDEVGLPGTRTIAYPYGRSSALVQSEAETLGYSSGWLVDGGWAGKGEQNRFALPRLAVPGGASARNVMMRVAGILRS